MSSETVSCIFNRASNIAVAYHVNIKVNWLPDVVTEYCIEREKFAFIFHILNFHLEFFSLFHDKLHEAQKKFLAMQKISSRAWRAANLKEKFFSASYAWVLPGNTNNKQIQYKMSKCESCMHYISIICTLTLELSDMTFDELLGADLRPA